MRLCRVVLLPLSSGLLAAVLLALLLVEAALAVESASLVGGWGDVLASLLSVIHTASRLRVRFSGLSVFLVLVAVSNLVELLPIGWAGYLYLAVPPGLFLMVLIACLVLAGGLAKGGELMFILLARLRHSNLYLAGSRLKLVVCCGLRRVLLIKLRPSSLYLAGPGLELVVESRLWDPRLVWQMLLKALLPPDSWDLVGPVVWRSVSWACLWILAVGGGLRHQCLREVPLHPFDQSLLASSPNHQPPCVVADVLLS